MPNTLDVSFIVVNDTMMPFARTSLLLAIQRTLIGEYGHTIVLSRQELNKEADALVHSSYDLDSLYIQFRLGESGERQINPEALVAMAEECKSKLEDTYKRNISATGKLCPCSDEIRTVEF